MLLASAAIVFGLALLVWSADRFVIGAAALARNLGVPPLLIGLTVVGFGTSAPEIVVAVMASLQQDPGIAIGNAIGSNIANVALILGATALVAPLTVQSDMLRREYPLLLGISIGVFLLLFDGDLDEQDGVILLVTLVLCMWLLVRIGLQRRGHDPLADEFDAEIPTDMPTRRAIGLFLLGLVLLIISSRLLVWGAVEVATAFGVSDLVIGLTIIAVGTSLPELAASIASALKNEHDLAIGNVVGSNIWNLLAVLAAPALLAPGLVPAEVISRDMLVMLGLTLALFLMGRSSSDNRGVINRFEGSLLLMTFITYQGWILLHTVDAMA
jgi:cation:H+ antiporter